jgi:DnaA family protein
MPAQLPLGLALDRDARFDNFFSGPNAGAVHAVCECAAGTDQPLLYLWGGIGSGKTHLLQAACQAAAAAGSTVAYVPLDQAGDWSAEVLEGLEAMALVCIDDLQAVAGRSDWEQALFALFNRLRDGGHRLAVAAVAAPAEIGLRMPDLASRLGWGGVFHLQALSDDDKLQALVLRARARGLELPAEVGGYLLTRFARDMPALFGMLEQLDRASLAAQRRLTVPFVKQVLGG